MTLERAGRQTEGLIVEPGEETGEKEVRGKLLKKKCFMETMGRHINAILCPRYVLVVVRHGVPLEENQSGLSTRGMGKGIGCVRSTRLDNL